MTRKLAVLLLLGTLGLCGGKALADDSFQARIIGGQDASHSDYDFFVSIVTLYRWGGETPGQHWNPGCGASYIGDGFVLTAAHCVDGIPDGAMFGVLPGNRSSEYQYEYCTDEDITPYNCTGENHPDGGFQGYHFTGYLVYEGTQSDVIQITKSASTVAVHPNYNPKNNGGSLKNDVALIKLPYTIPYDTVQLTSKSFGELPANATVIGHGNTTTVPNTTIPSATLQELTLPLVSDADCRTVYVDSIDDDSMLCAGYEDGGSGEGQDSCQGDSGGPLFISANGVAEQVGIVSFGIKCAETYGVYSDVAGLRIWILSKKSNPGWTGEGRFGSTGGSLSPGLLLIGLPLLLLRRRRWVFAMLAVAGLSACSSNPFKPGSPEVVFNPEIGEQGLEFSVMSTGCTDESHLYLRVKGEVVEVRRTQPDRCRAAPHLVRFVMPLPEGETVWRLENPVRYSNRVGSGVEHR